MGNYCTKCGIKLIGGANFCPQCGAAVSNNLRQGGNTVQNERIIYVQAPRQDIYVHSRKSKGLAMTLCFFLGWMGAHEFYLRNYFSGSLYLIFSWTLIPMLLSIIDFISLLITPKSVFHKMYDK
jgi:TM2 domain-containing membrane protein YozV